ncbi:hypothetical protein DN618_17900 [Aeromonas caviae]|nr:hypothetical protein DN618_17900 [Aeromonas caviae]
MGVWGATEQKVHLSPAPARKPLWRLVSSGKPSFCRTLAGTDASVIFRRRLHHSARFEACCAYGS